jgi:hypothetical protein
MKTVVLASPSGLLCALVLVVNTVAAADPWADSIIDYQPGSNAVSGFTTASAALGQPTRITNPSNPFGGPVTPSNASWGPGETVSIGEGGLLVIKFDEPVINDPLNLFGLDLIVFGNSFFTLGFGNPDLPVTGVVSEGGIIEVSGDGNVWTPVPGAADGLFPTNGYADIMEPFPSSPGTIPADFTRPVDPAFNPIGKTFAQLIAGYAGSGGGLGIDLGAVGLSSVQYVRITNPSGSGSTPEIDAFADVAPIPEPAASTTFLTAAGLYAWQNRKRRYRKGVGGGAVGGFRATTAS